MIIKNKEKEARGYYLGQGHIKKHWDAYLDPDGKESDNANIAIFGPPGSRKSTLIKDYIKHLEQKGKIIFLFDLHNEFHIPGANYVEYTIRDTQAGLNPFEFDCDLKHGGPKARTDMLVSMIIDNFMPRAGEVMEEVLRKLINDTYIYKGILEDDPTTWPSEHLQEMDISSDHEEESVLPTMKDLLTVYKVVFDYVNSDAAGFFTTIRKAIDTRKKLNANKEANKSTTTWDKKLDSLRKDFEEQTNLMMNYILEGEYDERLNTFFKGSAIDLDKYNTKQIKGSLDNLGIYIERFAEMEIFNQKRPRLIKGLNIINISSFTNADKPELAKFFIDLFFQRVFRKCKLKGKYIDRPGIEPDTKFDTVLAVDESRLLLPTGKDRDNPYNIHNRIALEGRKFGVAELFGTQRPTHASDEILSAFHTRIVMGINSTEIKKVASTLGIAEPALFDQVQTAGVVLLGEGNKPYWAVKLDLWDDNLA